MCIFINKDAVTGKITVIHDFKDSTQGKIYYFIMVPDVYKSLRVNAQHTSYSLIPRGAPVAFSSREQASSWFDTVRATVTLCGQVNTAERYDHATIYALIGYTQRDTPFSIRMPIGYLL